MYLLICDSMEYFFDIFFNFFLSFFKSVFLINEIIFFAAFVSLKSMINPALFLIKVLNVGMLLSIGIHSDAIASIILKPKPSYFEAEIIN